MVNVVVVRLLALIPLGLPATAVAAQPAEDPRPREAKAACAAGEIQKGIRLLADLYADTEDLNWVYNQGRCYQQNGWADEAIERFQEYLRRAPDIPPAERAEVERFIAELETRRQRRSPDVTVPVAPSPVAAAAGSGPQLQATPARAPDPLQRRLAIAAVTFGAAGGVALVAGLAFGSKVRSLEKEVEGWNGLPEGAVQPQDYWDRQRSARRYEIGQRVSYSLGALALAGGGACLYLGWRRQHREPSVALGPLWFDRGAGGQLRLRF
jgi:hypothetical protein